MKVDYDLDICVCEVKIFSFFRSIASKEKVEVIVLGNRLIVTSFIKLIFAEMIDGFIFLSTMAQTESSHRTYPVLVRMCFLNSLQIIIFNLGQ